jgi:DNA modification methylase
VGTLQDTQAKLEIGFERVCACAPSHLNCLSAKEWVKSQVAIWEFFYEGRDVRKKDVHPATFPISFAARCVKTFSHEGELVLDPFVGSGTTLVAAQDLNRNGVGFDLKAEYIDLTRKRLGQTRLARETRQIAIRDDARNIPAYINEGTVKLSVTSPPYAKMLNRPRLNKSIRGNLREKHHFLEVQQYSNDVRDLGTMEPDQYASAIAEIYGGILPLMMPKGHVVINVADLWWKEGKHGKRTMIPIFVIKALESVGYEFRNIMIWDRRPLVNNVGIFGWPSNYITLGTTFQYILDFWRPPD